MHKTLIHGGVWLRPLLVWGLLPPLGFEGVDVISGSWVGGSGSGSRALKLLLDIYDMDAPEILESGL